MRRESTISNETRIKSFGYAVFTMWECSSWLSWCRTEDDKHQYTETYYEREGITLDYDQTT